MSQQKENTNNKSLQVKPHNRPQFASKTLAQHVNSKSASFWAQHITQIGALLVLALVLYAYSITFRYALDDMIYITSNKFTKLGLWGIPDLLTQESFVGFWGQKKDLLEGGRYRPLTIITYAIEYQFLGETPQFSHFINIILYALLGVLLYRVLYRFFPPSDGKPWYANLAFAATALYIAHPLHVEWVANIKGRMEILTVMGVLASLHFAFKYIDQKQVKYIVFSCIAYFLALLTKENAITFLAILPLSMYFFSKSTASEYAKINLSLLAITVLFLLLRYQVVGFFLGEKVEVTELLNDPFLGMSTPDRYATIFYTMGLYVLFLFVPYSLTHDYYPYHIPAMSWSDWRVGLSLLLYIATGIYALVGLRRRTIISYGIWFYLFAFSIVSNLVFSIGSFMNDRFMDLPSVGFCIVLAYLLVEKMPDLFKKIPSAKVASIGFLLVLGVYSLRTLGRVPDWYDNETLFLNDVNISTGSTKVNTSAGGTLIEKAAKIQNNPTERTQLFEQGIKYLDRALKIYPQNTNALLLLGNAYYDMNKDYDKMLDAYGRLLDRVPDHDQLRLNLSIMSESEDNIANVDKLIAFYEQKILPLNVNKDLDFDALGVMYGKKKNDLDKSIFYFEKALVANPKNIGSMQDLGIAYGMKGNFQKAIELNQEALKIEPNNAKAYLNIAISYQNMGDKQKADLNFQKAFTLDPKLKR